MLVATFVMAFSSCQKQEVEKVVLNECKGLLFSSEKPVFSDETKTEWTGETIQWSSKDAIRIAYTCDGVWQNADGTATKDETSGSKTAKMYASTQLTEASATAQFSVPGNFTGNAEGEYVFYGVYPNVACVTGSDFKYAPSVTVSIPAEQTPLVSTFDPKADLMAAKSPQTYTGIPTDPISLLWTRIVAHGHLTLKGLQTVGEEKISTITLTADSEADMVGQHYLYLDTYNVVKANGNNTANVLTINADNLSIDAGNVTFWACFLPCVVKSLTVEVETDMATYTRVIETCSLDFKQNARNILLINMASAERVEKETEGAALPFEEDFSSITSGNSTNTGGSGTKVTTDQMANFNSFATATYQAGGAVRIGKSGSLETKELNLAEDFHVIVSAKGWSETELLLTVSAGDQSNDVNLTTYIGGDYVEYVLNFNAIDAKETVKFTTTSSARCFIDKIQIKTGHAELPSVLKATAPGQMPAAGGDGSFTFTLTNPKDGQSVSATEELDWISDVSVAGNKVTYTVAANTSSESREGTITLKYEGVEDVKVTVTQAGYVDPDAGGNEDDTASVLFSEDFSSLTTWSTTSVGSLMINGLQWTTAGATMYSQSGCIKVGNSSAVPNVGVIMPKISQIDGTKNVILKFKAVSSDGAYSLSVTATDGATVGTLSPSAITKNSTAINNGATTSSDLNAAFSQTTAEFSVEIENMTANTQITIKATTSAKRWYIDDVIILSK